ncbi:hypothetical protein D3C73_1203210 [compost metagenome]
MVAMEGSASGSMILKKIPKSLLPSILADSSRLSGSAWKKLRMMIILKALMATGKIRDQ